MIICITGELKPLNTFTHLFDKSSEARVATLERWQAGRAALKIVETNILDF